MKKLIYLTITVFLLTLAGCAPSSSESDLNTTTPDDYPRIMGNWNSNYNVDLGNSLNLDLSFTPSQYVSSVWYVNGAEYASGTTKFDYTPAAIGVYDLKLVVSTSKYETYREATITVK